MGITYAIFIIFSHRELLYRPTQFSWFKYVSSEPSGQREHTLFGRVVSFARLFAQIAFPASSARGHRGGARGRLRPPPAGRPKNAGHFFELNHDGSKNFYQNVRPRVSFSNDLYTTVGGWKRDVQNASTLERDRLLLRSNVILTRKTSRERTYERC